MSEEKKKQSRASMITSMVTSALPSIATSTAFLQMVCEKEKITDEAKHHLQLAVDHLETASLFIAKFTCDMEPGAEGTEKIKKVRDEMEKDVEQFKKEMEAKPKGRKIEVEDGE